MSGYRYVSFDDQQNFSRCMDIIDLGEGGGV